MANFPPTKQNRAGVARLLEADVELLSEQRWDKIEQGVFARLDGAADVASLEDARAAAAFKSRRWLPHAAVAACLLVASFAFSGFSLRDTPSSLSRVATGATASRLELPGIVLDVSPESAVVVSGNDGESRLIVLDRGEVTCDVAHRRPGAPLIVQAGEVQVEVVGTRFSVTRLADVARVAVQEGVVKVSARGQTTRVHAGESWPEEKARAAQPEPVEAKAEDPAPAPSAQPLPALPAEEASTPRAPTRSRVLPPSRPRPAVSSIEETTLPALPASPPPPDLQSQFETAAQLEARDPARAIQLYQALENGTGSWAHNALFAHGRLLAARGNRAEARRILQQYLARSPQGPNAADARLLLGRLE